MTSIYKQSIDELYDKLLGIEKKKQDSLGKLKTPKMEYQRLEYKAPTDDEITDLAEKTLKAKYDLKRSQEKKSTDEKVEAFKKLIEEEKAKEQENLRQNQAEFDKAGDKLDNELIKRGVQRSSIAIGEIANLQADKINKDKAISTASQDAIKDIDEKIQKLNDDFKQSLANFDLEQAREISQEIYSLKEKRQKDQDAVIKYNNSIAKDIFNYERSDAYQERLDEINSISTSYENQKVQDVINYYFYNYDSSKEAYEAFLKDEKLKEYLSKTAYGAVSTFLRTY